MTIEHLQDLGVTAIELMPVPHFANDWTLIERGLSNYWGYNTIGSFAPDFKNSSSTTSGGQVQEFKTDAGRLKIGGDRGHSRMLAHTDTAEKNCPGPTLSMRGIDNAAYYRLVDDVKRYYLDYTGPGISLHVGHPHTLQLIMDSLRARVTEMHVDGFRLTSRHLGPRVLRC